MGSRLWEVIVTDIASLVFATNSPMKHLLRLWKCARRVPSCKARATICRQAGNSAKVLHLSELVHSLLSVARSPPCRYSRQRGLWPCVFVGRQPKRGAEIRGISAEDGKLIHAYRWRRLSVVRLRPGAREGSRISCAHSTDSFKRHKIDLTRCLGHSLV
jgi:hypothetical protein